MEKSKNKNKKGKKKVVKEDNFDKFCKACEGDTCRDEFGQG